MLHICLVHIHVYTRILKYKVCTLQANILLFWSCWRRLSDFKTNLFSFSSYSIGCGLNSHLMNGWIHAEINWVYVEHSSSKQIHWFPLKISRFWLFSLIVVIFILKDWSCIANSCCSLLIPLLSGCVYVSCISEDEQHHRHQFSSEHSFRNKSETLCWPVV